MKRAILTIVAAGLLAGMRPAAAQSNPEPDYSKTFKNNREMYGYAIGMNYATVLKRAITNQNMDIDVEAAVKGFKDNLTGGSVPITEADAAKILTALRSEMIAKETEKRQMLSQSNKLAGEAFLAKNKNEPGVIVSDSGLQYKVLTPGKGTAMPKPSDVVTVKYRGTFIDGKEFDNSTNHNGPAEFRMDQCPPSWPEALQQMTAGAKWRLFIPSKLAYGEMGLGKIIGPNQTLIFDVELVSFKAAPPPQPMEPRTSDIIKVPSADEMKKGAKIETIKPEDMEKERLKESQAQTNK